MKFTDEVEKLQIENPGKVILAKNGIFFVAIGKDALILNKELELQKTCIKKEVCKVGFLVKDVEKYIRKMQDKEISFAIYIIDLKSGKIERLFNHDGKVMEEEKSCSDCSTCAKRKQTDDEILERLRSIGK